MDNWVKKFTKHLKSGSTPNVDFDLDPKDFLKIKVVGLELSIEVDEKKLRRLLIDLMERAIFNALELDAPDIDICDEGISSRLWFRENDWYDTFLSWREVSTRYEANDLEMIGKLFIDAAEKSRSAGLGK